jgi:hypothetical protein
MKYLQIEVTVNSSGFGDLAYWRFAYDRHGAPLLDELAAVIDHVKAFSTGGGVDLENLATACNRCNMRKNNSDAEKWEREHPIKPIKAKHGEPVNWDGFSNVFVLLARRYSDRLARSEKEWLKVLTDTNMSQLRPS